METASRDILPVHGMWHGPLRTDSGASGFHCFDSTHFCVTTYRSETLEANLLDT